MGGFFSRMLHKVTGGGAAEDGDVLSDAHGGPYSQQALTQMVERKRRNDAIRLQEFAALRQLRSQGGVAQGQAASAAASAFLSSALESDTRAAHTLQKINAIEAQMAQQWWRHPIEAAMPAGTSAADAPAAMAASGSVSDLPEVLPAGMLPAQWRAIPTLGPDCMVPDSGGPPSARSARCGVDFFTSPGLEEAAILWAQGDLDGAKARLLALLVQALDQQPTDAVTVAGVWHAVLDLYGALGDEEGFEPLAIDYAAHFGRSAPLWRSLPALVGVAPWGDAARPPAQHSEWQATPWWHAPFIVTVDTLAALQTVPMGVDWSRLALVEPAAVPGLARLLEQWASQPGQCTVADAERWLALIEAQTRVGDAAQAPAWWALHMAALRWLNRPQVFEQVALDYCVTYEVSPPSWVPPQCQCVEGSAPAAPSGWRDTAVENAWQTRGTLALPAAWAVLAPSAVQGAPALVGVIEGDAIPWLRPIEDGARLGQPVEIACDGLIRLDFVAAGSLLNWVADMQAHGHVLRFVRLHHVLAVFFQVIGIQAHATLQVRAE